MGKPLEQKEVETFFCYRCGEDGHLAMQCSAPEDLPKVISKLIRSLKRQKRERRDFGSRNPEEKCTVKKSTASAERIDRLPAGLVGKQSLGQVTIEGHPCSALMDSGSMVTIIFERWYEAHLSHIVIQPLSNLSIWGLGKSSYPYKGYVAVEVRFRVDGGWSPPEVVLALVCPDPQGPGQVAVIIGTNARSFAHGPAIETQKQSPKQFHSWRVSTAVTPGQDGLSTLSETGVGYVKWSGPGPLVVAPGEAHLAMGDVTLADSQSLSVLVLDAPGKLPGGVFTPPCVLLPANLEMGSCSVLLQNESLKRRVIPKGTVIAQIYKADIVTEIPREAKAKDHIDPKLFNFEGSVIPSEWKDRLAAKLSLKTQVFSLEEWDVGLAKGIQHHIRLNDSRPFRERSRRIALADIDEVRRHLQGLLAAGIIKESRSPYASPIVIARKKNGSIRMCIDYRTLNSRTIPDQYTVPRIDDVLDCLAGSR